MNDEEGFVRKVAVGSLAAAFVLAAGALAALGYGLWRLL